MGGGSILLAFCGLWIAHAIEYARAFGPRDALIVLAGSVHLYMIPLGFGLAVAAALASSRLFSVWMRLGTRLDRTRGEIARVLRGRAPVPAPSDAAGRLLAERSGPSRHARLVVAWPALTVLQLALYLGQENLEALRAGTAAPGFGAISGVHALAPAVHALVALVLLLLVLAADRLVGRRAQTLDAAERLLRRLLQRFARSRNAHPQVRSVPPAWLLGDVCRQRPPPLALHS